MIKEIRIHARAGQGAITAAMLLAMAAFYEDKQSLAFPHFGSERMGAPMNAFVRLGDQPIRLRTQIQNPDYIIVLDETLLRGFNVAAGLKDNGIAVINTDRNAEQLGIKDGFSIVTVPASRIAEEVVGRKDRANTALLGAFAAATGEIKLSSLEKAIASRFSGEAGKKNIEAMKKAYEHVRKHYFSKHSGIHPVRREE